MLIERTCKIQQIRGLNSIRKTAIKHLFTQSCCPSSWVNTPSATAWWIESVVMHRFCWKNSTWSVSLWNLQSSITSHPTEQNWANLEILLPVSYWISRCSTDQTDTLLPFYRATVEQEDVVSVEWVSRAAREERDFGRMWQLTIFENNRLTIGKQKYAVERERKGRVQLRIQGGGARGPWPPPVPVKTSHKKDGRHRRPLIFHVSWPPPLTMLDPMLGCLLCNGSFFCNNIQEGIKKLSTYKSVLGTRNPKQSF